MVLQSLVLTFNDIGPKGATAIAKGIQVKACFTFDRPQEKKADLF